MDDLDEGIDNLSNILSSVPLRVRSEIYHVFTIFRSLLDQSNQGKIPVQVLTEVLQALHVELSSTTCKDEFCGQDSEPMEETENENEVNGPLCNKAIGFSGQPVRLKESIKPMEETEHENEVNGPLCNKVIGFSGQPVRLKESIKPMEETENENEVNGPLCNKAIGFSGQPVRLKESIKESSVSKAQGVDFDMTPHHWSNQIEIISNFNKCYHDIQPQLEELETRTQRLDKEEISSSQPENKIPQWMVLQIVQNIRDNLQKARKYAKRYEDLAFAGLGQKFDFTNLSDCFTRFFKCLEALHSEIGGSNWIFQFFTETLKGAWILDSGDQLTKNVCKRSPKAFKIMLRLIGCVSGVSMEGKPELKMMTAITRQDLQPELICTSAFDCAKNILTIENIIIRNCHWKEGDLLNYERLYILRVIQRCSFLGFDFNLEYETCPFTLHTSANQYTESIFTVKWCIFSQEDSESEGYVMRKNLSHQRVLQMLNLLAENNTPTDRKRLDQRELSALSRLLKRQNSGDKFVSMASIGHDKMHHPRKRSSLKFSFYTWFQAGLNTLAFFCNKQWERSLMLGFYSMGDANALLKEYGNTSGDTVIRLSETSVSNHEGTCPKSNITFHIAFGPEYESFIECTNASDDLDLFYEIGRVTLHNPIATICQQFLPRKLAFCSLFPSFSLTTLNRYHNETMNPVVPVPIKRLKPLKNLRIKVTPSPSSSSSLEADTPPGHPVMENNGNEQGSVMLIPGNITRRPEDHFMEEQEQVYGESDSKMARHDTKLQVLVSATDPWLSSTSSNTPPDLKAVSPSLSPMHPDDIEWLMQDLVKPST